MKIVSMDRLAIGDGEFLNPHHQARKETQITEGQQMILDEVYHDLLLENEKRDIDDWLKGKTEKRKLQELDLEVM